VRNKVETVGDLHLASGLIAIINEIVGLRRMIFGTAVGSEDRDIYTLYVKLRLQVDSYNHMSDFVFHVLPSMCNFD
jgi:hypothetical protein